MNNADWPKFLPMKLRAPTRTRGGNHEALLLPSNDIDNTFGACAPKIFNDLPQEVRTCGEYKVFLKKLNHFYLIRPCHEVFHNYIIFLLLRYLKPYH